MRTLLFLFLTVPFFSNAQVNRSAREFASEQIREYITTKLFKDQAYHPVSFGELKNRDEKKSGISWTIEHKFEITETHTDEGKATAIPRQYKFIFFLDNKMKVIRAQVFYSY
jgi:hypothetical protein